MDAAQNYTQNDVSGMAQSELESRALIRTASALNSIKEHWDERQNELAEALEKNRKLWTIIASAMSETECPQPEEIKKSILNLSMFIFQRTVDMLANPAPGKLDALININMNIAKGLSGNSGSPEK